MKDLDIIFSQESVKHIYLCDSNLLLNKERAKQILQYMDKTGILGYNLDYRINNLKKIVIVYTLLILCSVCFGVDVYLGITQGFNIGMQYLSESDFDRYGAMVGYNGGFQANFIITNLIFRKHK